MVLQLRNELLYQNLNRYQNQNQVYMLNNGSYYYTNPIPYYGQPIVTITPRQRVEQPVEENTSP